MSKTLDIRAGDRFETVYPFIFVCTDHQQWDGNVFTDERWIGGCRKTFEPADCGYGDRAVYTADAEGKRILEVLSVAEMPESGSAGSSMPAILLTRKGKKGKAGRPIR